VRSPRRGLMIRFARLGRRFSCSAHGALPRRPTASMRRAAPRSPTGSSSRHKPGRRESERLRVFPRLSCAGRRFLVDALGGTAHELQSAAHHYPSRPPGGSKVRPTPAGPPRSPMLTRSFRPGCRKVMEEHGVEEGAFGRDRAWVAPARPPTVAGDFPRGARAPHQAKALAASFL